MNKQEIDKLVKEAEQMILNIIERTLSILAKLHQLEEKINEI